MEENQNYYMEQDIDNTGVSEVQNPSRPPVFESAEYDPFKVPIRRGEYVGEYFHNDSRYDPTLGNIQRAVEVDGLSVDDLRYDQQNNASRLANALVNNLAIAGTTAVQGTLGTVYGLLAAAAQGEWSKIWDNDVNNAMADVQKAADEWAPVYRGELYQNKSMWQKLGNGVFWSDFIKNLGYTEGMLIPGTAMSSVLSKAPQVVRMLIPSLVGSFGEATAEAVNNKNEQLDYAYRVGAEEYQKKAEQLKDNPEALAQLNAQFKQDMANVEVDAVKAGNAVQLGNVALLTASNIIQWGKLFSKGFGTQRKTFGQQIKGLKKRYGISKDNTVVDNLGRAVKEPVKDFVTNRSTRGVVAGAIGRKFKDALTEGLEEVNQGIIAGATTHTESYNRFNASQFNPEAVAQTQNIWSALGLGLAEALGDKATAEEFMMGALTGFLGAPGFSKGRPTWQNSVFQEVKEAIKQRQGNQEVVNFINNQLSNLPKTQAFLKGLVTQNALQNDMNNYVEQGDEFNYQNAANAELFNSVQMYAKAGMLDTLRNVVNNSIDMSDEGIAALIQETSKDGNGPFMTNGVAKSIEEVRKEIQKRQEMYNKAIDDYIADYEELSGKFPEADESTMDNVLFLKHMNRQLTGRRDILGKEFTNRIKWIYNNLTKAQKEKLSPEVRELFEKGLQWENLIELVQERTKAELERQKKKAEKKNKGKRESTEEVVENEEIQEEKYSNPLEEIYTAIYTAENLTQDVKDTIAQKLVDISKLQAAIAQNTNETNLLLSNPYKSIAEWNAIKQEAIQREINEKKERFKQLGGFQDMAKFMSDESRADKVLEQLIADGDEKAKAFKNFRDDSGYILEHVSKSNLPDSLKLGVLMLLDEHLQRVNTTEEFNDIDSIFNTESAKPLLETLSPELQQTMRNAVTNAFKDLAKKKTAAANVVTPKAPAVIEPKGEQKEGEVKEGEGKKEGKKADMKSKLLGGMGISGKSDQETLEGEEKGEKLPTPPEGSTKEGEGNADFRNEDQGGGESDLEGNHAVFNTNSTVDTEGPRDYYMRAIPEIEVADLMQRNYEEWSSESKNPEYQKIYNYFKQKGTFVYLNRGRLKEGDVIHYGIDPEMEKIMQESFGDKYTGPTILMYHGNQVVGSLHGTPETIAKYRLGPLRQAISEEYNKASEEERQTIWKSKITTRVTEMLPGRIKVGDKTERNELKNIPNLGYNEGEVKPIFAIMTWGGGLITNGALSEEQVGVLNNSSFMLKGRVYLLLPNGAGQYIPMAVVHKGIKDIQGTPIWQEVDASIRKIAAIAAQASTEGWTQERRNQIKEAFKELTSNILLKGAYVDPSEPASGNKSFIIKIPKFNENGNIITKEDSDKWDTFDYAFWLQDKDGRTFTEQQLYDTLIRWVLDVNPLVRIRRSDINKGDYNKKILDSNVLQSNVQDAYPVGTTFRVATYNPNEEIPPGNGVSPVGGRESDTTDTTNAEYQQQVRQKIAKIQESISNKDPESADYKKFREFRVTALKEAIRQLIPQITGVNPKYNNVIIEYLEEVLEDPVESEAWFLLPIQLEAFKNNPTYQNMPEVIRGIISALANKHLISTSLIEKALKNTTLNPEEWKMLSDFEKGTDALSFFFVESIVNPEKKLTFSASDIGVIRVLENLGNKLSIDIEGVVSDFNKLTDAAMHNIYEANKDTFLKWEAEIGTNYDDPVDGTSADNTGGTPGRSAQSILNRHRRRDGNGEDRTRIATTKEYKKWDVQKEMDWLNKVLPQLSKEERVHIVEGLIDLGKKGAKAWGLFHNGMILLSDVAAQGTTYHEAFHVVFNLLLNKEQRDRLLREAKSVYGNKSAIELEEQLAEAFREYTMSRETPKGFTARLKQFFRQLLAKVLHWKQMQPYTYALFKQINQGKFANEKLDISDNSAWSKLSIDTRVNLMKVNINSETYNNLSRLEQEQAIHCFG